MYCQLGRKSALEATSFGGLDVYELKRKAEHTILCTDYRSTSSSCDKDGQGNFKQQEGRVQCIRYYDHIHNSISV